MWVHGQVATTYMSVKDLNDVFPPRPEADLCAGDALADVPVPSPKSRRTTIEGVLEHGALLDWPATQDGEAATKGAAVVEFPIGEDLAGVVADGRVVVLGPTLLKRDNVWRGG